jgi:hypothetical protein
VAGSWTTSDQGVPPASLSSLLLLEPHGNGEQADEAGYPWGTARCLSGEAGATQAILLAKRTAWRAQPVTQDAAWTMYSMRGRAGAEGLGRVFGTSPCGKGGSAPHFTFAHQLRVFQCPLQKANGPVPDPEPFPRRSIGPTTGARAE